MNYLSATIFTLVTPSFNMPTFFAAAVERSMIRPFINGPRSLILTIIVFMFSKLVTLITVDSGKVLCAAVKAFWL